MNRRGFLGSVIGLYVGSKLPFISEAVEPKIVNDQSTIFKFIYGGLNGKLAWKTFKGEYIYAPSIERVQEQGLINFISRGVILENPLQIDEVVLLSMDNKVIATKKLNKVMCFNRGDIVTTTIGFETNVRLEP